MPYRGEPYDQAYFEAEPFMTQAGYTYYPRFVDLGIFTNWADDIEAQTGPVAGKDVLDIGCAYGYLTAELAARGANAVGIDISPWAIAKAQILHPGITFIEGDFLSSPFGNNDFHLTCVIGIVECMNNDAEMSAFLSEARRVNRPNGKFYALMEYKFGPDPIYLNYTWAEWLARFEAGIPGPFDFDAQDVGHLPVFYGTRVVVT